jgi:hypothetical protein
MAVRVVTTLGTGQPSNDISNPGKVQNFQRKELNL